MLVKLIKDKVFTIFDHDLKMNNISLYFEKTSLSCNILIYEKNSYLIKNYFPILNSEYQHMSLNQRKRIEYKYFSVILESSNPLIIKHSEIDKYVIPALDQLHYPEENISNIFLNEVF